MTIKKRVLFAVIQFCAWLQLVCYRFAGDYAWRSADGRVTLVSEMSDRHLSNCIKMLIRNVKDDVGQERVLELMVAESFRRLSRQLDPLQLENEK